MKMKNRSKNLRNYDPNDYKDEKNLNLNPLSYPNCGCYHNDKRPLKQIIELNLEEQMNLSDAITRKYALNEIFLEHQISFLQMQLQKGELDVFNFNATSIGNLAFIKHYNPNNLIIDSYYQRTIDEIRRS